jgi:glycosyltransferase involved in cell wall biosynthesis
MKLSIIIPVYNVEKWLERCVRSVENQDLPSSEYEAILVNDGSTDNSGQIAKDLSEEYDNIVVIDKKNEGQSSARNEGMKIARGEYYMFVDSDDYLYPNVIGSLISLADENDLDVCHYNMNVEDENGETSRPNTAAPCNTVLTGKDVYNYNVIGSVCTNVIRASLIRKHHFNFTLGIIHEDVDFTTRLFCFVKRIMFVDKDIYHYSFNLQSSWRSKLSKNQEKDMRDALLVSSLQLKFAESNEISPWFKESIQNMVNTDIVSGILSIFRLEGPKYPMFKMYIDWARSYGLYPVNVTSLRPKFKIVGVLLNAKYLVSMAVKLLDKM